MKIRIVIFICPVIIFFLPIFIYCKSVSMTQERYKLNDTVTLYGEIGSGMYLSRDDNSDMEYFNDSYNLKLEKSIEIVDDNNPTNIFENIDHIEIEDDIKYEVYRFSGKRAKIKGVLTTFTERAGYYRQYSTPIKISIIEFEIEDNDCNGGIKDALKDIEEKNISLVIIGPKRYDGPFTGFFTNFLQEKYHIKLVIYGCEIDSYIECYEKEISKELTRLYGEQYLEKFENEARSEYKSN